MDRKTFDQFRKIIYEKSGISLGDSKEALVSTRIAKRMRLLKLENSRDYLQLVIDDDTGNEIIHLLDAISTNVTSFFREPAHFEFLSKAVAAWVSEGSRKLRLWSAACSTGEEPYTLAMVLKETLNEQVTDVKILATDLSTRVLDKAIAGSYEEEKVKTVITAYRDKYFERSRDEKLGTVYTVKPVIKKHITFKRLNLAAIPFPMQGPMDVVLCRNVMIYFDNTVRRQLLKEVYRLLKPGGYLMVGHAESLIGLTNDFKIIQPSIYQKV